MNSDEKKKRRYEPPKVYDLDVDLTQAMGQTVCSVGNQAAGACNAGGTPAGVTCQVGSAASTQCRDGGTPGTSCGAGNSPAMG